MESIKEWVMTLCACAALLSLAEVLMPDGAVKKTAYLVKMSIACASFSVPMIATPFLFAGPHGTIREAPSWWLLPAVCPRQKTLPGVFYCQLSGSS